MAKGLFSWTGNGKSNWKKIFIKKRPRLTCARRGTKEKNVEASGRLPLNVASPSIPRLSKVVLRSVDTSTYRQAQIQNQKALIVPEQQRVGKIQE